MYKSLCTFLSTLKRFSNPLIAQRFDNRTHEKISNENGWLRENYKIFRSFHRWNFFKSLLTNISREFSKRCLRIRISFKASMWRSQAAFTEYVAKFCRKIRWKEKNQLVRWQTMRLISEGRFCSKLYTFMLAIKYWICFQSIYN